MIFMTDCQGQKNSSLKTNASEAQSSEAAVAPSLASLYRNARAGGQDATKYAPPSEIERKQFAAAFGNLVRYLYQGETEKARALQIDFQALGFELNEVQSKGESFFVVTENKDKKRGSGFYAVRVKPKLTCPLVLMAPHTFFDVGTGDIALSAFTSTGAFVLMTNTFHRYAGAREQRRDILGTDFAHRQDNFYFSAFNALLQEYKEITFVQIHGFTREIKDKRRELSEDAILSSGCGNTNNKADLRALSDKLSKLLTDFKTGVYGESVENLGATKNVHACAVVDKKSAEAKFVHLEMSERLRQQLKDDKELQNRFAGALVF